MGSRIFNILLALLPLASGAAADPANVAPARLRCEYRINPEGIGETRPRLGWILEAGPGVRGARQTAYRILVASSPEILADGRGDLWDTGKFASDRMNQIVYAGQPLVSLEQCWWKVRVWDEAGRASEWSAPARWSIGLVAAGDWTAQWIGLDCPVPADGSELSEAARARLQAQRWAYVPVDESRVSPLAARVRGVIGVPAERRLVRATLALTPDQVCAVSVNGRRAGEITRWEQMRPLDLTGLLGPGENVVGLAVTQYDGYRPSMLGEVELAFDDGSTRVVPIDEAWKWSAAAAAGWDRPGFDESGWAALFVDPQRRNPWDGPPQTFTRYLPPAPLLRKPFALAKPVRRAEVYSTALGAYELQINGSRVGRDHLTPGWTDFSKRVQYQTYDVTAMLRPGANALGAALGDGWYASVLGYTGVRYFYGGYPRLRVQLEVEFADGTRETFGTDGTWRAAFGPIRSADLMAGCVYDGRLEIDGWSSPGFDDSQWRAVAVGLRPVAGGKPLPEFTVEAANAEPTRVFCELPARSVAEPRPGAYTFDLGQNIAGWVRLKVSGRPGQRIRVRHGERLNPNGTLYTSNLRGANAADVYYLRGGGIETLEPHFTFHGFRYAEVSGLESRPGLDAVTGIAVQSDLEATGGFECSNPLVNQLFCNAVWSQRGNYLEVPTDCPQRDERAGWSGDAQFFIRTAAYNFDIAAFFSRWLTTLATDSQLPNGSFANVAPAFGNLWTATGWSDATILCTHALYRMYGDTRLIERHYPAMERYMAWRMAPLGAGGAFRRPLGDHLNMGGGAKVEVIDAAYAAHLNGLMAEMAAAVGRPGDAARYVRARDEAVAAFPRDWMLADGSIRESSQTGYALAFTMGLVPAELRAKAAERFVDEMRRRDWHLATGFIGTPRLLPGLHLAGRDDVAYRVLLQETYPSWLFPVKNGATTIWERWDGWTPDKGFQTIAMNSFNHYAFGSVCEYIYRNVAGIEEAAPGFREIAIRPSPAPGLTHARATYDSISGRIESAWKIENGRFSLRVVIPPNTTATVRVPVSGKGAVTEGDKPAADGKGVEPLEAEPGAALFRVGSGTYEFSSEFFMQEAP